jgi:uncharacterized protein (DUF305 family)
MKITYFSAAVLAGLLVIASPSLAQEHKMMKHDAMAMTPTGDQGASSKAFAEANAKMHKDMAIKFSGDADKDFVRVMIAHHQGAIDMAKVELKYGKDEEIRKLATDIIAAQEGEIKLMKGWLAKHGG